MSGRILTVAQVADLIQMSPRTVMRAIKAGHLEASQLAQGRGGWRIYDDAVPRWMEARSSRRRQPSPFADVAAPVAPSLSAGRRQRGRDTAGRLSVIPEMGAAG